MQAAIGIFFETTAEQAPNRFSSGAVATVVVLWAWAVAIDTWTDAFAPTMAVALLSGAALDAWAHGPAHRRPAFARATPAAFFLLLPLFFLQPWHHIARAHPSEDLLTSLWPTLALVVALAAAAVLPGVQRRPGALRAAGLAALALAYLATWLVAPAAVTRPSAGWIWTSVFGAAAILTGVSLVREAARGHDLGLFVIGVLHVAGFVGARAIGSEGHLWQSALALFGGALVLWWLARTWARRSDRPEARGI
jgi:hypothetical protein